MVKGLSVIGVRRLNIFDLIRIINGKEYGECTIERARRELTTIDPNYKMFGHLLKTD